MSRPGALAGALALAAVVVYAGATALGGALDPGYSQVSMHVSELTSSHAPDRTLLAALYSAYNVAIAGAGLALLRPVTWSRWLVAMAWLLVAVGVTGVLLVTWFPQDSYGQPATTAGALHIALAGIAALLSIAVMITAGRAFQVDPAWAPLARPSGLLALAMGLTGVVAAVGTAVLSPYMGLLERLPIGTFMLWLAGVAWFGLRGVRRPVPVPPGSSRSARPEA